jgi:PRTRC genetic system ThiF family protein
MTDPTHYITVTLVGCGGTGSVMLGLLARIHFSMLALGRNFGLHVQVFDPGKVREANIVRQLFHPNEIGMNKATALVTRINRYYGLNWLGMPYKFGNRRKGKSFRTSNILITCSDNTESRISAVNAMKKPTDSHYYHLPRYWMDIGNRQKDGQIVLGTLGLHSQPESSYEVVHNLDTLFDLYPDYKYLANSSDQGPSCSLMEALREQDLFINGTLAHLGANMLWKLLTNYFIEEHAIFLNLDTNIVKPKKV